MALQYFDSTSAVSEITAATIRDGAAVVANVVPDTLIDTVASELRENLDTFGYRSKCDFSGHGTKGNYGVFVDKDDYSRHYRATTTDSVAEE